MIIPCAQSALSSQPRRWHATWAQRATNPVDLKWFNTGQQSHWIIENHLEENPLSGSKALRSWLVWRRTRPPSARSAPRRERRRCLTTEVDGDAPGDGGRHMEGRSGGLARPIQNLWAVT